MSDDQAVLQALIRQDLASFIAKTFMTVDGSQAYKPNWHIEVLAYYLERAAKREIKRLVITVPPRHLKSIAATVAFPAWLLGHNPGLRVICASYSDELARKHARDCRSVMESRWYKQVFPGAVLSRRKSAEHDFETTKRGFRYSTSVGGALTGRGGNVIIIDDPIKMMDAFSEAKRTAAKQWLDSTLYSRLDDKANDVIIMVMQRAHVDDPVAHVLQKEGWVHLNLPAIADTHEVFDLGDGRVYRRAPGEALHPAREPLEVLERTKVELGEFAFSAQYQQNPLPEGGNLVKWDWFRFYDQVPRARTERDMIVQSWDTAMKAHDGTDWSVCTTWAIIGADCYLLDVYRARLDFPALLTKVVDLKRQFNARTVLIEDKGSGTGLIQQLRKETSVRPIAIEPRGTKADRMAAQSVQIEAGRVYLPEKAPWLDALRAELSAFPHGKHDDQVDSLSQFLSWADERGRRRITVKKSGLV